MILPPTAVFNYIPLVLFALRQVSVKQIGNAMPNSQDVWHNNGFQIYTFEY